LIRNLCFANYKRNFTTMATSISCDYGRGTEGIRQSVLLLERFQRETISQTIKITDHSNLNQCSRMTQWMFYQLLRKFERKVARGNAREICYAVDDLLKFIADFDGVHFGHQGGWEKGWISKAQIQAWNELRSLVLSFQC